MPTIKDYNFIYDREEDPSQQSYRSYLNYQDPLTTKNPSGWVRAYFDSKGITTGDQQGAALESLGFNPPYKINSKGQKDYDISNWLEGQNSSFQNEFFNKVGLNTDQAKLDLIGSRATPGSEKYVDQAKNESSTTPIFSDGKTQNKPVEDKLAITKTLTLGSTGEDVKKLQTYLRDTTDPNIKVDGIFGPKTKAAVMQFQSKNGLAPDGIFGPKSIAKYDTIRNTATQINSATPGSTPKASSSSMINPSNPNDGGTSYNTGDPAQDALLEELRNYIKAQQDAGLKINQALNFDQRTLDKFLETAKKQVHPFYQNQIDTIKQDVLRAAPQILQNYESTIADTEANFQNTLDTSRENMAGAGLAFSGQRAKGELGLAEAQNRDLASLSQGYGNKLYELGRGAEEKIGAGNMFDLGALKNYSTNLAGSGGFTLGGVTNPYQKGGYKIGTLEYSQEQDTEARRQALLKSASESVVAGRDYSSLFN